MNRLLQLCIGLYLPHLLEEHLMRMYDDPVIIAAFGPLAALPARQASYLVFQLMLAVALAMTLLYSRGGLERHLVMGALAVALLGEAHHLGRWLVSQQYNPGLWTSLPMPVLGIVILRSLSREAPLTRGAQS